MERRLGSMCNHFLSLGLENVLTLLINSPTVPLVTSNMAQVPVHAMAFFLWIQWTIERTEGKPGLVFTGRFR